MQATSILAAACQSQRLTSLKCGLDNSFQLSHIPHHPAWCLIVQLTWTPSVQLTVVFLANAEACLPDKEEWPAVWAEQQAFKRARSEHEAAQAKVQVRLALSAWVVISS